MAKLNSLILTSAQIAHRITKNLARLRFCPLPADFVSYNSDNLSCCSSYYLVDAVSLLPRLLQLFFWLRRAPTRREPRTPTPTPTTAPFNAGSALSSLAAETFRFSSQVKS